MKIFKGILFFVTIAAGLIHLVLFKYFIRVFERLQRSDDSVLFIISEALIILFMLASIVLFYREEEK